MFVRKPNIVIIGAGKIASSLIPSLIKSNYKVSCVISTKIKSSERLAKKYSIPVYSNSISGIPISRGLFTLSVPDSQIQKTANSLAKLNLDFKDSLFIHLSGSKDVSLLKNLHKKKGNTASFHIMQSFPSLKPVNIKDCYSAIEANDEETFSFLEKFAISLKLIPIKINSENKNLYHLAGVFASNFFAGNISAAQTLFASAGIKDSNFVNVIEPILKSTLNNIKLSGPVKSISGPIDRGDFPTIKEHISSLRKLAKKKKKIEGMSLLLSYINQSLFLLEAVQIKYGSLNEEHIKIKDFLIKTQKELI